MVSRIGTLPTTINYALDIYLAYYDCAVKAAGDNELQRKLLLAKKLLFISKFSEFPMQFHYLSVRWARWEKGDAAAIGIISPLIFMLKHFNILEE